MSLYLKKTLLKNYKSTSNCLSEFPYDNYKYKNNLYHNKNSYSDIEQNKPKCFNNKKKNSFFKGKKKRYKEIYFDEGNKSIIQKNYTKNKLSVDENKPSFSEILTIFSYDYIKVIRNIKNFKKGNNKKENNNSNNNNNKTEETKKNEIFCSEKKEKKIDILNEIEKEQITQFDPFMIHIENEFAIYSKKFKQINIIYVKKYNKKKKKYILKKKIKKIYRFPKEVIFNPFLNDFICYENVIKLERYITRNLSHENIIIMESHFYFNDEIITFYEYGGTSLMKWNKEGKHFQLQELLQKKKKRDIGDLDNNNFSNNYDNREKKKAKNGKEAIEEKTKIERQQNVLYEHSNIITHQKKKKDTLNSLFLPKKKQKKTKKKRKKTKKIYVYPEYLIAEILRQLLKVCFFLYEKRVYHSDIKPSNIVAKNIKKKNLHMIYFCKKNNKWYIKKKGKIIKKKVLIKLIDLEFCQKMYDEKANAGGTTSLFKPLEDFVKMKIYVPSKIVWLIGITIFILSTGKHPFSKINNDVHIFYLMKNKKFNLNRQFMYYNYFSDSFKDLLKKMLQINFEKRISFFDLFFHPFVLFG